MSISGVRHGAGWAALGLLLAIGPFARADEPATRVTPLDLAPQSLKPPPADVDPSPTGAVGPRNPPPAVSRLDLSPPPGLAPDLPPEAPAPAFTPPSIARVVDLPASDNTLPPAPAPSVAPTPTPTPAAPAQAAPVESPAAAAPADVVAAELQKALDGFVAAKPVGRPIGAGDWDAARHAIAAVYAERAFAPLWIEGDGFGARARAALTRIARADEDGLNLAATPAPAGDLAAATPEAKAQADIALSTAVVAYALQASGARLSPRNLAKDVTAKPEVADPGFALKSVAAAEDPDAALAAFNPPQRDYRALRDVLATLPAPNAVARLAAGPVLRLGMSDPRVPLIRARFGLGASADPSVSEVYDVRVASAVAAFQRVHGLPPNGALNAATASAIDSGGGSGDTARERLLLANMEMWRWEPRDMGETRVEVNVPDFSLKLMKDDNVVFRTRVIVGKPDTPTPIFSNAIKYMLFNPVWRVPDSIIKKEMAPRAASDPDYFARHGYKVSYVGDKLVVEQPPGEANALGRMLFLFPNEHAVYLHDTPSRSLFSASFRALSHGCVRVENPAQLAEILMGGAGRGWTEAKVRSLLGDKERYFSLPTPAPVHLEYFTAFVDENGTLRERSDVYGLTGKVVSALANLRRD